MIGACCAVATEVFDPTTLEAATWSSHWLCAGGFRQIVFFFLFVVAMAIWFPRESLLGYNYEVAGDGQDGETIDLVKTNNRKELAPYDEDWFYVRTASMA